jgi:hypothetical protein
VGDHVVDENDVLAFDGTRLGLRHLEGARHVAAALVRRKPHLTDRPAHPRKRETIDRHAREPADLTRQHGRLIEPPRPEPP